MSDKWEDLLEKVRIDRLRSITPEELANRYPEKKIAYFEEKKTLYEIIPRKKDGIQFNKVKKQNPPKKIILKHRSKTIGPTGAITEFIDNIFDNYEKNLDKIDYPLEILLKFYEDDESDSKNLLIKENSGGIVSRDVNALITMGETSKEGEFQIGTWGEAFLNSVISLSTSAEVFTYHLDGIPIYLQIPEDFFTNEEWELELQTSRDINALVNLDKGSTIMIFRNINKYISNELDIFKELIEDIQQTFWSKVLKIKLKGYDVSLKLQPYGLNTLEARFKSIDFDNLFTHYPYCPPIYLKDYKINIKDEDGNPGEILVDSYCGINPFRGKHLYSKYKGVWMFGNGRRFANNLNDSTVGYGVDETDIPSISKRSSFEMLSIFLFFKSKKREWNKYIPWNIPTKLGYNFRSSLKEDIFKLIAILVNRFLYPLKQLVGGREFIFKIFTYDFTEKSLNQKVVDLSAFLTRNKAFELFCPDIDGSDIEVLKSTFSSIFNLDNALFEDLDKYDISNKGLKQLEENDKEFLKNLKIFNKTLNQVKKAKTGILHAMTETFIEGEFLPSMEIELRDVTEKEELTEEEIDNESEDSVSNKKKLVKEIKGNEEIEEVVTEGELKEGENKMEGVKKQNKVIEKKTTQETKLIPSKKEIKKLKSRTQKLYAASIKAIDTEKSAKKKQITTWIRFILEKKKVEKLRNICKLEKETSNSEIIKVALELFLSSSEKEK